MPPKGKQGTRGAKQIAEENKETLSFYIKVIAGVNILFYGVSFLFYWDDFTTLATVMSVVTAAVHLGSYQFMRSMAAATWCGGQLLDPGTDLNMEQGMAEHVKDLILLTSFTQVAALISNYFWLFFLLAPGRAFYMLWIHILSPYFFAEHQEEQIDEKKQRKMERKQKRMQIIR